MPAPLDRTEDVILGRHRWLPDGSGIAFVGLDERGRAAVLAQDFATAGDTSATRRRISGAADLDVESFGISPDGARLVLARIEASRRLMLAENLPGVVPRAR